jgi:hypothetical protein
MIWDLLKVIFFIWILHAAATFGAWLIGLNFWVSVIFSAAVLVGLFAIVAELACRAWENR